MRKFIPLILLAASFTRFATATSVLVIDGPDGAESPVGWYSLLGEYLSQSWTQSTPLVNVSISAAVFTDGSSGTAEAYLSTQIGPSTTAAVFHCESSKPRLSHPFGSRRASKSSPP